MKKLAVLGALVLIGCAQHGPHRPDQKARNTITLADGTQAILVQCGKGVIATRDTGRCLKKASNNCPMGYDVKDRPDDYTMIITCK